MLKQNIGNRRMGQLLDGNTQRAARVRLDDEVKPRVLKLPLSSHHPWGGFHCLHNFCHRCVQLVHTDARLKPRGQFDGQKRRRLNATGLVVHPHLVNGQQITPQLAGQQVVVEHHL